MDLFNETGDYIYFMKYGNKSYKIDTNINNNCIYCITSKERIFTNSEILAYIRNKLKNTFNEFNQDDNELFKILYFNSLMQTIIIKQKIYIKNKILKSSKL